MSGMIGLLLLIVAVGAVVGGLASWLVPWLFDRLGGRR